MSSQLILEHHSILVCPRGMSSNPKKLFPYVATAHETRPEQQKSCVFKRQERTHLMSWINGLTAPFRTIRLLFSWQIDRLNSAVVASFFPRGLPVRSRSTNPAMAPGCAPICCLHSSRTERLNNVAAAFSFASWEPFSRTSTNREMAPAQEKMGRGKCPGDHERP